MLFVLDMAAVFVVLKSVPCAPPAARAQPRRGEMERETRAADGTESERVDASLLAWREKQARAAMP